MELGVWVEGSLRVVCGLSVHTSVQEVVIALAQDLGQTGRYVLTLKLHGSERQLLKDDRPLHELSVLGSDSQYAEFHLRRTGPSMSSLHPQTRPRTPDPLPSTPRAQRDRYAQPSSIYGTYPRRGKPKKARSEASVEKEAVYVEVLERSRRIEALGEHIAALERQTPDLEVKEEEVLERELREQLEALEERQRQNQEELLQEEYWRSQMEEEERRAKDLSVRMEQLQWTVHHQTQRMDSLLARSLSLQTGVREQTEEALRPLQQELEQRHLQADRINAALEETDRRFQATEERIKSQRELLEELNKELRQCNLQQFILQASGSAPSDLLLQSGSGGVPSDLTHLPPSEIYLSSAGILE